MSFHLTFSEGEKLGGVQPHRVDQRRFQETVAAGIEEQDSPGMPVTDPVSMHTQDSKVGT